MLADFSSPSGDSSVLQIKMPTTPHSPNHHKNIENTKFEKSDSESDNENENENDASDSIYDFARVTTYFRKSDDGEILSFPKISFQNSYY